jgi:hypothetical protein
MTTDQKQLSLTGLELNHKIMVVERIALSSFVALGIIVGGLMQLVLTAIGLYVRRNTDQLRFTFLFFSL